MNKNSYKAFPLIAIPIMIKDAWNSIMTIEHSPLRKLDPQVAHMVFTILGFMWSGIFAVAIMDSITAFGISALAHIIVISGFFIIFFSSSGTIRTSCIFIPRFVFNHDAK